MSVLTPILRVCAVASLSAAVLLTSHTALAKRDEDFKVRAPTYKVLQRIQKLMDEENYQQALKKADEFAPRIENVPFELALLNQIKAYIHMLQGEPVAAISIFENVLANTLLPESTENNMRYNLAQLYIQTEQLDKGLTLLEKWLATVDNIPADAHALAGQCYYLKKNFSGAEQHLTSAVNKSKAPQENWYKLLLATHFEQKQYEKAEVLLRTLLRNYPNNREYWVQHSNIALILNREQLALASLELAEDKALLEDKDLIKLVKLNMHNDAPHRAARLLQSAIDEKRTEADNEKLQLLADAWIIAREYEQALKTLQKAIDMDKDNRGQYALRKGEILIQLERWQDAATALKLASSSHHDDAEKKARANLLLGISAYYLNDYAMSHSALQKATLHASTRDTANDWYQHTKQQLARQQQQQ